MTRFIPSPELLSSPTGRAFTTLPPPRAAHHAPTETDVAIIGAGVAGTALAARLSHGTLAERFTLLDPGPRAVHRFLDRADSLGLTVLRSPYEHHLNVEGDRDCELVDLARASWPLLTDTEREQVRLAQAGQRAVVPLDLFRAHTQHVDRCHGVSQRMHQTTVAQVEVRDQGFAIHHTAGPPIQAQAVVWATGEEIREVPSSWYAEGPLDRDHVRYWNRYPRYDVERAAVIGAGLTAAHLVVKLAREGAHVVWIMRGQERFQCSDVDARFFRPEGRARFAAMTPERRSATLALHRRPSIMFELRPELERLEREGRLTVRRHSHVEMLRSRHGKVVVTGSELQEPADAVYPALGLSARFRPPLLINGRPVPVPERLTYDLSVTGCPRAFVTGAAAAMVLGPAARNIDGARVAAARVEHALRQQLSLARTG